MTTQETIEKLKNYDELEGKYNEALARIDEYERERADVLAKIAIAKKDIEKEGIIAGALNSAIDMLKPSAPNDNEIKIGDVVERNGELGLVVHVNKWASLMLCDELITLIPANYRDKDIVKIGIWEINQNIHITGKHYPILETLDELRGEHDETH